MHRKASKETKNAGRWAQGFGGRAETGHLLKSNMSETTIPIKVKWLKNKYDVNVMLDEPAEVLKAQVCADLICWFHLNGSPSPSSYLESRLK